MLGGLARFAPILEIAEKVAAGSSDDVLGQVADLLGKPENRENVYDLLVRIRDNMDARDPTPLLSILGSPAAKSVFDDLMTRVQKSTEEENSCVFVRCPNCAFSFEQTLKG